MKILKILLYCLWWLLFAGLFTLLGAILVYMWENGTNNQIFKELTGWWIVNDSDIIGEKTATYVIPLFPSDENTSRDVPNVTLRSDSTIVKVWDTVTFRAIPKILSNNADFEKNRMFYYDFDWNWIWDLVTKQDEVKYRYINLYEEGVTPSVAVEYEWNFLQAKWATILVVDERDLMDAIEENRLEETEITIPNDRYEKNKDEILALLPTKWDIKQAIEQMFNDYEKNFYSYTNEEKAERLNKIWNTIINDGKKNKWLNENDFTWYFCNIFDYYSIANYTDKC